MREHTREYTRGARGLREHWFGGLDAARVQSGKPRMKAPATERPMKTPRRTARFSGGDASAMYAWHTLFMQLDTPSTKSATNSIERLLVAFACR